MNKLQNLLIVITLLLSNLVFSQELKEIENFGTNPGNLKLFVHDNKIETTDKIPLVIVLHGCGENAEAVSELTGWNKLADLHQFKVIYPQQKRVNNVGNCYNWFQLRDIEKGKGECESVYQMIQFAVKNYNIDTSNIHITGLSAGGAMSMVLVATHPETFKSAAIFAGGAYKIATNAIEALKVMNGNYKGEASELTNNIVSENLDFTGIYPKLIVYQGLKDKIVTPTNAQYIIQQWCGVNKIDSEADGITQKFNSLDAITQFQYLDLDKNLKVIYYEIKELGHKLLIKPGKMPYEGGKIGIFGLDIGFHSTYQTAIDFGLIKLDSAK